MGFSTVREITWAEQVLLSRIGPRHHDWKNTEEGTPVCMHCKLWPDDPFIGVTGGWKSGQCWGPNGADFVMRLIAEGIQPSG